MIQFFAFEDMAPSPPPFPPLKVFLLSFWQVEALPITARRRVGVGEWEFPKWPGILYLFFFLCCSQTKYRNPVKKYKYFPSFYVHTSNESLHYKTIVDTTKGGQANLQVFKFLSSIRKCTSANFCGMQVRQSQIRKFFYDYPQMANPQICVTPVGNAAKEREVNVYTTLSQSSLKSTVISFTKFLFSTKLN